MSIGYCPPAAATRRPPRGHWASIAAPCTGICTTGNPRTEKSSRWFGLSTEVGSPESRVRLEGRAQAEFAVVDEVRRRVLCQAFAAGADDRFDELLQRVLVSALHQLGHLGV